MPVIASEYNGPRWVKNAHLQTILPALLRNKIVNYKRERISLPDHDFMDLDWLTTDSKKLLILLHGLEGSSQSHYIKAMADYAHALNWNVCSVNFRSCSGEPNLKLQSYHSGATHDVHTAIRHIQNTHKYETIAAAGFSLGGNVLLKYLGEHKYPTAKVIQAAVAVSVPVHLADCSTELAKPHNRVYLKRFMKSLKRKMLLKSRQFHDSIDKRALDKVKDFYDFDDLFTAPIHGFDSASHYYEVCSSIQYLPDISTPALLINALNDPFLAPSCHPKNIAAGSKYLHFENPVQGGHVGFAYNHLKQSYWAETRIMSFIHEHS